MEPNKKTMLDTWYESNYFLYRRLPLAMFILPAKTMINIADESAKIIFSLWRTNTSNNVIDATEIFKRKKNGKTNG